MADTFKKLSRQFDTDMVPPIRKMAIGRKLMSKNPRMSGAGIWNIDVTELTELSPAFIDFELPAEDDHIDAMQSSISNKVAPVLWKKYRISRSEYDSFKTKGVAIDSEVAISAAQVVTNKENTLLVDGFAWDGSTYDIEGLYQAAENTDATANDFGTYGNALAEVAIMKGKLAEDDIYGMNYNLSLHPTQFAELDGSVSANGIREFEQVMKQLNPVAGDAQGMIMQTTDITAGTAMLTPVDPTRRYFEYYELQAMRNILGEDSKAPAISPIYGTTMEVLLPHIKHGEAICTATGV